MITELFEKQRYVECSHSSRIVLYNIFGNRKESECSTCEGFLKYERKNAESSLNVIHVSQKMKTSKVVRTLYKKIKRIKESSLRSCGSIIRGSIIPQSMTSRGYQTHPVSNQGL